MAHCVIHVHRLIATVYRDKRTYYNSVIPPGLLGKQQDFWLVLMGESQPT